MPMRAEWPSAEGFRRCGKDSELKRPCAGPFFVPHSGQVQDSRFSTPAQHAVTGQLAVIISVGAGRLKGAAMISGMTAQLPGLSRTTGELRPCPRLGHVSLGSVCGQGVDQVSPSTSSSIFSAASACKLGSTCE
jgi:hypothetical protein